MFNLDADEMQKIIGEMADAELFDTSRKNEYDSITNVNNKFCFSCSSACQNYAKQK